MKRFDLIRRIEEEGAVFVRHGAGHDLYRNAITGKAEVIRRHREIKEILAKAIIKRLSTPA